MFEFWLAGLHWYLRRFLRDGVSLLEHMSGSLQAPTTPVSLCLASPGPCPRSRAPLQTLHMDVWGPASVTRQGGEHYFLLVVDDYTRYTTVFPLQSKAHVRSVCRSAGSVLSVASSALASGRTSRSCGCTLTEVLNLWPHVSHPETSPTLRWTGEIGDASAFWVWGSLSLVRDPPAGKLSPRTLRCAFLGFPTDAPPWQFYHLDSRRVLSSQDVTFDESDCFYHLHRSSPVPLPPLFRVDPSPLVAPLEVSSDTSGPAEGGDPTAADTMAPRSSTRLAAPPGFPP
ncbi:unnamed protein product [Closterium sp. NIES-53]